MQQEGDDTGLSSTVTVLVSPEQARLLAELEQGGSIHAALVYRGSSGNAKQFLEEQARVLEDIYSEEPDEGADGENAGQLGDLTDAENDGCEE